MKSYTLTLNWETCERKQVYLDFFVVVVFFCSLRLPENQEKVLPHFRSPSNIKTAFFLQDSLLYLRAIMDISNLI